MNWKVYQHGENIQEAGLRSRATADVIPPLLAVERLRLSAGMTRENDTCMSTYNREAWQNGVCTCQISFSDDLLHWTPPERISAERADLSNPYLTICPEHNAFRVFMSSNGTGIRSFTLKIYDL